MPLSLTIRHAPRSHPARQPGPPRPLPGRERGSLLTIALASLLPLTGWPAVASEGAPARAPEPLVPRETSWPAGSPGRQMADDLRRLLTRPARLRGRQWILPAALAGGAGGLYALRQDIREEAQTHRSSGRDEFLQDVRLAGQGGFVPGLAAALALVGVARDSAREKQTSLLLIESFGASALIAAAGSTLLAAERPREGDSVRFLDTDGHGVSLDTALAASMIGPLDRAYFRPRAGERGAFRLWRRLGRAVLHLVPALVAAQRVNQDDHWAPDVFLGYATGLLVGRSLARSYDSASESTPPPPSPARSRSGTLPGN